MENNWKRREEIWQKYNAAFSLLPVGIPPDPDPDTRHAYHLYTLMIDVKAAGISRDAFLNGIQAQNIGAGVHYLAVHEHEYYQKRFGWKPEHYPEATRVGRQTVSIPLSAALGNQDVEDVIEAVRRVLRAA